MFSRPTKGVLAAFVILPISAYIYLKSTQADMKKEARQLEEEGRRNWIQAEKSKDFRVHVGRSGGGV